MAIRLVAVRVVARGEGAASLINFSLTAVRISIPIAPLIANKAALALKISKRMERQSEPLGFDSIISPRW